MSELEQIRSRVDACLAMGRDPEVYHSTEDDIFYEAFRLISEGHPSWQEIAKECMRLVQSDRDRWYA